MSGSAVLAMTTTSPLTADQMALFQRLRAELGMSRTMVEYLVRRGFSEVPSIRRFLSPRLSELADPSGMRDHAVLVDRLALAVRKRERVCVFGDYDCDGITSTAILTEVLRHFGAEVTPLLANRFEGGYGLGSASLAKIRALRPQLLITCDCGSSEHESLAALGAEGLDCVVIDHHLVPERALPVLGFLNPHQPDCGFAFKHLASCGLALLVAAGLRSVMRADFDLRNWLDLVAIGTIADVAPLTEDNRILVSAGLRSLAHPVRPGLRALFQVARLEEGGPVTAEDIAFRIAPRLNAPGRMESPEPALALLLEHEPEKAEERARELEDYQKRRRQQQETMLSEAVAEIRAQGWDNAPGIVVARPGWNVGVVGIVAGRLTELFGRPVAVVGFSESLGRGSVRVPTGVSAHGLLAESADCLMRFGGHEAAAGLELAEAELARFRERFAAAAATAEARGLPASAPRALELALHPEDDPLEVARELALLEPCGQGNPAVHLRVTAEVGRARDVRGGHLRLELVHPSGARFTGFGPNLGARAGELRGTITITGQLRESRYGADCHAELRVLGLENPHHV